MRPFGLLSAVLLVAIQLGGCARSGGPAPVEIRGQETYSRAPSPAAADRARSEPGVAVVGRGDTLFAIARSHNIPTRAIIDANGLRPPYALRVGQRLTLPQVRTHAVQSGDTVNNISRRYGVEMSELVRANAIEPPYRIVLGQTLILPGSAAAPVPAPRIEEAPATVASGPPAVPAMRVESAPLPPQPGSTAPISAAPMPSAPAAAVPAPQAPVRNEAVVAAPPVTPPSAAQKAAEVEPAASSVPLRAGRAFQWPVRGRVISDFGPKGGGLQNDGINIAASRGTPIRAAENGVVVYAGNELRGFGNLLLLRHADGWMTAYGHADELIVARGDQVRRGQAIGRVGSTGNVTTPQVHFEIRRGSRAVNPRDHLGADTASSHRPRGPPRPAVAGLLTCSRRIVGPALGLIA